MTSADRHERSPEVERLLEGLRKRRGRKPAPAPDIQARLAAIKRAAEAASWEEASLAAADATMRRAAKAAEELREHAKQSETTHNVGARHVRTPTGPGNRPAGGHGTPAHVSRHNADSHAPRHHFDRTLQRAAAERARLLVLSATEAEVERRRIIDETHVQVQQVAEDLRRETHAHVQWAWLSCQLDRWAVLVGSAMSNGAADGVPAPALDPPGLPIGNGPGFGGSARSELTRRQPSNDPSTKYWVELVQCVVLAAGYSQSPAEMTGRTFEEVLDTADGLDNFNSDLRGWLQHRWYRPPGR
ncbi:hypothetical protein [Dactylosporangium sp. NPDC005555]|uniref:hypothetical protein n=1 Tax=Dactylosporangium sp. NPDC005555 TaxID=3154889 RepID=UPI0033A2975E